MFEHDLHNFSKVKTVDLGDSYADLTEEDVKKRWFGRLKDCYYLIKEKKEGAGTDSTKSLVLFKGKEEFKLCIPAKYESLEAACINEKGDKFLTIMKVEGGKLQFTRLFQDKNKSFKQENFDFKNISALVNSNDKFLFEVIPTQNDFIIAVQKANDYVTVFHNDTKIV